MPVALVTAITLSILAIWGMEECLQVLSSIKHNDAHHHVDYKCILLTEAVFVTSLIWSATLVTCFCPPKFVQMCERI